MKKTFEKTSDWLFPIVVWILWTWATGTFTGMTL